MDRQRALNTLRFIREAKEDLFVRCLRSISVGVYQEFYFPFENEAEAMRAAFRVKNHSLGKSRLLRQTMPAVAMSSISDDGAQGFGLLEVRCYLEIRKPSS